MSGPLALRFPLLLAPSPLGWARQTDGGFAPKSKQQRTNTAPIKSSMEQVATSIEHNPASNFFDTAPFWDLRTKGPAFCLAQPKGLGVWCSW